MKALMFVNEARLLLLLSLDLTTTDSLNLLFRCPSNLQASNGRLEWVNKYAQACSN